MYQKLVISNIAPEYTNWNLIMIFDVISTMFTNVKMVKVYMVTLMLLRRILPKCMYVQGYFNVISPYSGALIKSKVELEIFKSKVKIQVKKENSNSMPKLKSR